MQKFAAGGRNEPVACFYSKKEGRKTDNKKNGYLALLKDVKGRPSDFFWQASSPKQTIQAINKYISGLKIQGTGPPDNLAEKIYNDIAGYSVLTDPLKDVWVKRIQAFSWDRIIVQFINGEKHQIDGFSSADVAQEMLHRLIQDIKASDKLRKELRLTAVFPPTISEDTGVQCNIMKYTLRDFTGKVLTANGFAEQKELNFLLSLARYGISLLIVGKSGTGKTTFLRYLLNGLSKQGLDVLAVDDRSELPGALMPSDKVSTDQLVKYAMGLNPDVIGCNIENCPVYKASLQGWPVISITTADDPEEAVLQASSLFGCSSARIFRAFPILVSLRIFSDGQIRIARIAEHLTSELKTIWEYQINGRKGARLLGEHHQVADLSDRIFSRMRLSGILPEDAEKLKKEPEANVERDSDRAAGSRSAAQGNQKERTDL